MSTTRPAQSVEVISETELDQHVEAIFDRPLGPTHGLRLVCTDCSRVTIYSVAGAGADEERPWLCPSCDPRFQADFRAWRRPRARASVSRR